MSSNAGGPKVDDEGFVTPKPGQVRRAIEVLQTSQLVSCANRAYQDGLHFVHPSAKTRVDQVVQKRCFSAYVETICWLLSYEVHRITLADALRDR